MSASHAASPPLYWTDRGSGPPVVLLHGFGGHGALWDPWLPTLEAAYRVINVDLKGFGRAPKPRDGRYDPRAHAEAVLELVRALELRRATLVGHSLGGGVALLAALRLLADDPASLAGIVSVAGAAYPQAEPPFIKLARWQALSRLLLRLAPKRLLVEAVMRQVMERTGVVSRERAETLAAPLRDPATQRALLATARHAIPPDLATLAARFPEIGVPTLCLWGRQDPAVPVAVGQRLARELPRGRLVVLEGCGHFPMDERPLDSLDAVMGFLDEIHRS